MHRFSPIRFLSIAGFALSASLPAQPPQAKPPVASQTSSTLPATPPTTPATTPDPAPSIPLTPAQLPPKRAQITYAGGALSISADNASLNQILRQIASDTGMKITGGVTDERVFGKYGPAEPAQILATLLDGTSSNMVIVQRDPSSPAELILTPRQGGPTPPNPNAAAFNDRSEPQETPAPQAEQPGQLAPVPSSQPVTPPANPGASAGATPANPTQPDSPNGVKTPQQIYEQLQRMRQQQQPTQPQQ